MVHHLQGCRPVLGASPALASEEVLPLHEQSAAGERVHLVEEAVVVGDLLALLDGADGAQDARVALVVAHRVLGAAVVGQAHRGVDGAAYPAVLVLAPAGGHQVADRVGVARAENQSDPTFNFISLASNVI